jgi:hypothetical protein
VPDRLSTRVVLAALRHGLPLDLARRAELRRALLELAPEGSQIAAFVELRAVPPPGEPRHRAMARLRGLALAVLGAPIADLPAESRLEAIEAAAGAALAEAVDRERGPGQDAAALTAMTRALAWSYRAALDAGATPPDLAAPGRIARLDLLARGLSASSRDALLAASGDLAADARRRAEREPRARVWCASTLVALGDALLDPERAEGDPMPDDDPSRRARWARVEVLATEALALQPHAIVDMDGRALLAKLYRRTARLGDAERALAPRVGDDVWTIPFAVEAVRAARARGDDAAFRDRARRAWERYSDEPRLRALAQEAGVVPR